MYTLVGPNYEIVYTIDYFGTDAFNKAIREYINSNSCKIDTWKLISICSEDYHLRVPTLEELKSVSYIKETKTVKEEVKKETKVEIKENSILQKLINIIRNIFIDIKIFRLD